MVSDTDALLYRSTYIHVLGLAVYKDYHKSVPSCKRLLIIKMKSPSRKREIATTLWVGKTANKTAVD